MSKYADMTGFQAGKLIGMEMEQHMAEYAAIKAENDARKANNIPAKKSPETLVVEREKIEMFLEAGVELGRLNQLWHDGDRSEATINQLKLANMAVISLRDEVQREVAEHTDLFNRNKKGTEATREKGVIRSSVYRQMIEIFRQVKPRIEKGDAVTEILKRIDQLQQSKGTAEALLERIRDELDLPYSLDFKELFKTGIGRKTIDKAIKDLFE